MRISTTDGFLSVALHTLQNKILPALPAGDSQAAAAILGQVLTDLLKRERQTPELLTAQLDSGAALLMRLEALCGRLGLDANAAGDAPAETEEQSGFAGLVARHELQTAVIASRAAALVAARASAGAAMQEEITAIVREVGLWDEAFARAQREATVEVSPPLARPRGAPLSHETLEAFLRTQHPDGEACRLVSFNPIPGGFGKQTFRAVLADAAGQNRSLIVRKSDPTPMAETGCFRIEEEFHLLRDVAANSDLPVAEPLWMGKDVAGVDADFYVMTALPGAVPSSFLGAASAQIPEAILLQIAENMARLHRIALPRFGAYLERFGLQGAVGETVEACYRRQIREWKDYFERGGHLPSPFVVFLLDWLERNVPRHGAAPVLVHGDFNIHNVLVEEGRVTGILDWECAMIGAPEQDLAYVRPIMSQLIGWDRFLDHYAACGGPEIDRDSMDFYMVFSAMRLCVIFNRGVFNMQNGISRDIRYAVIDLDLTPEFMKQALASIAASEARASS